jgi:hypothetical protein
VSAVLGRIGASLRLTVPLYLANLLLALGPAALYTLGLGTVASDRPWAGELLGGDWLNWVAEITGAVLSPLGRDEDGRLVRGAVLGGLGGLLFGAMVVAQGLAYTLLSGGILERLRAAGRERAASAHPVAGAASVAAGHHAAPHGVSFWAGCRRWFLPFFGLGLIGALAFVVLLAAVGVVTSPLQRLLGSTGVALLVVLLASILNGWLELARADMVRQQYRSGPRALVRSARLLLLPRVLARALLIWTVAALLGLGLVALNAAAIRPAGTVTWGTVLTGLLIGQGLAFLGAWLKVARLAAALTLDAPATRRLPVAIEEPQPPLPDDDDLAPVADGAGPTRPVVAAGQDEGARTP